MIEHKDGSVTLTAHEFKLCHMFLEMSSQEFKKILLSKDDGTVSVKDFVEQIEQRVLLESFDDNQQH